MNQAAEFDQELSRPVHAPVVSCIVICYNQAQWVREALDSVAAQEYPSLQCIILDDASTDGSQAVIADWIKLSPLNVRFIAHEKNRGVVSTVNEALALADGEYVALLAGDDVWLPGKLTRHVMLLEGLPDGVGVVYSDYFHMDVAGQRTAYTFFPYWRERYGRPMPQGDVFEDYLYSEVNFIHLLAALIRRSALQAVGPCDESLVFEDYDLMLRIARRYRVAVSEEPSAVYRVTDSSAVRKYHHLIQEQLFDIREKYIFRNGELDSRLARFLAAQATALYENRTPRHRRYLWRAFRYERSFRMLWLALCSSVAVPFRYAFGAFRCLRLLRRPGQIIPSIRRLLEEARPRVR